MTQLESRLPAVLEGRLKPADGLQAIRYALLCLRRERFTKAAEFYAEAFAANPKLADPPNTFFRTNAAQAAAQAGCGRGKDAAGLSKEERVRLRGQALAWLRDELKALTDTLEQGTPTAKGQALSRWADILRQRRFEVVRTPEALAKLPEDEARDWSAFWHEVRQRVERAGGKVPP
jgi:hypothetical protein